MRVKSRIVMQRVLLTGTGSNVGGLIGLGSGTITASYWDKETSGQLRSAGGMGKNTTELKLANAQQQNSNNPYYNWKTTDWDFGTSEQYPILKYARGDGNNPACDEQGAREDLPECGKLLSPAPRYGLSKLQLVEGNLWPEFLEAVPNYAGTVVNSTSTVKPK